MARLSFLVKVIDMSYNQTRLFLCLFYVYCFLYCFCIQAKIPDTIDNFLKNLGDAFSATALFLLGLSMVGRMQSLKGTKHRMSGPVIALLNKNVILAQNFNFLVIQIPSFYLVTSFQDACGSHRLF